MRVTENGERMVAPWCYNDCNKEVRFSKEFISNPKFRNMRERAIMMYLTMAVESEGHVVFTFPASVMKNYGYTRTTAMKAIKDLINAGFIRKVSGGAMCGNPNKYEFIGKWERD